MKPKFEDSYKDLLKFQSEIIRQQALANQGINQKQKDSIRYRRSLSSKRNVVSDLIQNEKQKLENYLHKKKNLEASSFSQNISDASTNIDIKNSTQFLNQSDCSFQNSSSFNLTKKRDPYVNNYLQCSIQTHNNLYSSLLSLKKVSRKSFRDDRHIYQQKNDDKYIQIRILNQKKQIQTLIKQKMIYKKKYLQSQLQLNEINEKLQDQDQEMDEILEKIVNNDVQMEIMKQKNQKNVDEIIKTCQQKDELINQLQNFKQDLESKLTSFTKKLDKFNLKENQFIQLQQENQNLIKERELLRQKLIVMDQIIQKQNKL